MSRKRNLLWLICLLVGIHLTQNGYAQNQGILDTIQEDDLGDVTDEFQDLFFQALTDRAIENYEKAIESLRKAADFKVDQAAVFFEMGKNYTSLEKYSQAENYFQKALAEKPKDFAILIELEAVYREQKQYAKAIPVVEKLIDYESDYYESLAELYFLTQNYIKALEALDDLENKKGIEESGKALRRKIYKEADDKKLVEQYLKEKIGNQPENIQHYTDLILVYKAAGQLEKAVKIALDLQEIDPDQPIVHLAFYQKYIQEGKKEEAVSSMKTLINAEQIPNDIKTDIIKEFRNFVKTNPEFESDLIYVLGEEISSGNQSNQQLAEFYIGKDNIRALAYYEKALRETPNNLQLILDILALQNKEKHFAEALELSTDKIDIFPTQARLYLNKGIAENGLKEFKAARETLLNGIDFVIDNQELQKRFYKELATSSRGLGEVQEAAQYDQKANTIEE